MSSSQLRTIKLTIAYDGTDYVGWQVQPNGPSVQTAVEKAMKKLTGQEIRLTGAGRTDSGVHAIGQVAVVSNRVHQFRPKSFSEECKNSCQTTF